MSTSRVTTSKAGLIGGMAVGIASLVLCLAVSRELGFDGPLSLGAGILIAAIAGTWTRLADL